MIRTGWLIVLGAGLLVVLLRAAGAPAAADLMATAYLVLATLTFGRARISPAPDRLAVLREVIPPDRRA